MIDFTRMISCPSFENLYWCCDQLSPRRINFQASKRNSPGWGKKKNWRNVDRVVIWQASSLKSTSNKYYQAPVLLAKFRMTPRAGVKSARTLRMMYAHTYVRALFVGEFRLHAETDLWQAYIKVCINDSKVLTRESRKCCWRSCNFARCGEKEKKKRKKRGREEGRKRGEKQRGYRDPNSRCGSQLYACAF